MNIRIDHALPKVALAEQRVATFAKISEPTQNKRDQQVINSAIDECFTAAPVNYHERLEGWINTIVRFDRLSAESLAHLIYGVQYCFECRHFFQKQSQHEFELSITWLKLVFSIRPALILNNRKTGRLLIQTAIVFSLYPGMAIRSLSSGVSSWTTVIGKSDIQQLFIHLFVRYQTPTYLIANYDRLNVGGVHLLMLILSGESPRWVLNGVLTKRQAHIFTYELYGIRVKDQPVDRGIFCARMVGEGPAVMPIVRELMEITNGGRIEFYELDMHSEYWLTAARIFSKVNWEEHLHSPRAVVDFLWYNLRAAEYPIQLKGRTANSLSRLIDHWHSSVSTDELNQIISLKWKGMDPCPPKQVHHKGLEYLFDELTSGKELYQESEQLHHCVHSYANTCYKGRCRIFRMYPQGEMDNPQLRLTIEVNGSMIVQVAGLMNRKPTNEEMKIYGKWRDKW